MNKFTVGQVKGMPTNKPVTIGGVTFENVITEVFNGRPIHGYEVTNQNGEVYEYPYSEVTQAVAYANSLLEGKE